MITKDYLKITLILALAGTLFSGYLTYGEFAGNGLSCTVTSLRILGLPACVYGLAMYLLILIAAILGIYSKK